MAIKWLRVLIDEKDKKKPYKINKSTYKLDKGYDILKYEHFNNLAKLATSAPITQYGTETYDIVKYYRDILSYNTPPSTSIAKRFFILEINFVGDNANFSINTYFTIVFIMTDNTIIKESARLINKVNDQTQVNAMITHYNDYCSSYTINKSSIKYIILYPVCNNQQYAPNICKNINSVFYNITGIFGIAFSRNIYDTMYTIKLNKNKLIKTLNTSQAMLEILN